MYAVSKIRLIFTGPTYKLLLILTVISDVYSCFIPNKAIHVSARYCLTQWSSELARSLEVRGVMQ